MKYMNKIVLSFMVEMYVNLQQIVVNIRFSCFLIEWRQILHKRCPLEIKEVHQWDPKKYSENNFNPSLNLFLSELLTTNVKEYVIQNCTKETSSIQSPSKYDIKSDHIIFFLAIIHKPAMCKYCCCCYLAFQKKTLLLVSHKIVPLHSMLNNFRSETHPLT